MSIIIPNHIIAIGASAGGMEEINSFLPYAIGWCFVYNYPAFIF